MNNLDHSLNLNFSRFNSINWNNINDDISQEASTFNRAQNQHPNLLFVMPNQPPRPANSIYSCIESQPSENSQIKEVSYIANEGETKLVKRVNEKQYFRIMKRRVKKGWEKISKGLNQENETEKQKRKKFMHQSRHNHAVARPRGKDGKFLATRPEEQRFREKKKRGRKPKVQKAKINEQGQSPTKNESAHLKESP